MTESVVNKLRERAKKNPKVIVFPEAEDERIVEAVERIQEEGIAKPLLLTQDNLEPERQEEFANLFLSVSKLKGLPLKKLEN